MDGDRNAGAKCLFSVIEEGADQIGRLLSCEIQAASAEDIVLLLSCCIEAQVHVKLDAGRLALDEFYGLSAGELVSIFGAGAADFDVVGRHGYAPAGAIAWWMSSISGPRSR